jgi:hypothetical protein
MGYWTEKAFSKPNTQSGRKTNNTKAIVGKKPREKIDARDKCGMCKKAGGCKCRQNPTKPTGNHKPVGTRAKKPPAGQCSCGAYTFDNGRCRDRTCKNY